MVRAKNRTAARPQAFPHRDVLPRIDLISHLALTNVMRADVFVDDVVLTREKTTTLERERVSGVQDDAVQHVNRNLQRHVSRILAGVITREANPRGMTRQTDGESGRRFPISRRFMIAIRRGS